MTVSLLGCVFPPSTSQPASNSTGPVVLMELHCSALRVVARFEGPALVKLRVSHATRTGSTSLLLVSALVKAGTKAALDLPVPLQLQLSDSIASTGTSGMTNQLQFGTGASPLLLAATDVVLVPSQCRNMARVGGMTSTAVSTTSQVGGLLGIAVATGPGARSLQEACAAAIVQLGALSARGTGSNLHALVDISETMEDAIMELSTWGAVEVLASFNLGEQGQLIPQPIGLNRPAAVASIGSNTAVAWRVELSVHGTGGTSDSRPQKPEDDAEAAEFVLSPVFDHSEPDSALVQLYCSSDLHEMSSMDFCPLTGTCPGRAGGYEGSSSRQDATSACFGDRGTTLALGGVYLEDTFDSESSTQTGTTALKCSPETPIACLSTPHACVEFAWECISVAGEWTATNVSVSTRAAALGFGAALGSGHALTAVEALNLLSYAGASDGGAATDAASFSNMIRDASEAVPQRPIGTFDLPATCAGSDGRRVMDSISAGMLALEAGVTSYRTLGPVVALGGGHSEGGRSGLLASCMLDLGNSGGSGSRGDSKGVRCRSGACVDSSTECDWDLGGVGITAAASSSSSSTHGSSYVHSWSSPAAALLIPPRADIEVPVPPSTGGEGDDVDALLQLSSEDMVRLYAEGSSIVSSEAATLAGAWPVAVRVVGALDRHGRMVSDVRADTAPAALSLSDHVSMARQLSPAFVLRAAAGSTGLNGSILIISKLLAPPSCSEEDPLGGAPQEAWFETAQLECMASSEPAGQDSDSDSGLSGERMTFRRLDSVTVARGLSDGTRELLVASLVPMYEWQ